MRYTQVAVFFFLFTSACSAQTGNKNDLPSIVKKTNGAYSLLVDGQPYISLGAQLWNSSDWPYLLDKIWPQLKELHCNTLEAPVYWQNIEPGEGAFNFKELDYLVSGARKEGLKLILLWFGTFKNGGSHYAPSWMMTRPEKYSRMKNEAGAQLQVLSVVDPNNLEADKKAFSAVMEHIKQIDGHDHTVILVQVENESGSLGTDRDYSEKATEEFKKQVPPALLQKTGKNNGNWDEVFGNEAAESFNAWCIARYINEIAAAGKKQYALPMYTNCWIREDAFRRPGDYPSGGPTSNMLAIWKLAAPALNFLAPDIYIGNDVFFNDICKKYSMPDNPFFIPEMGRGATFARFQFYALGNYNALGIAPYGIDPFHADPNDERNKEKLDDKFSLIAANYGLLQNAIDKIAELQGSGKLVAVGEEPGSKEQLVSLGDYDILISFGFPGYKKIPLTGRALIAQLNKDEFLIIGFDARFQFRPKYNSGYRTAEYITIEEGYYEGSNWVRKRIWNGDEAYHSTLTPEGNILKISLQQIK